MGGSGGLGERMRRMTIFGLRLVGRGDEDENAGTLVITKWRGKKNLKWALGIANWF